MRIFGSIFLFYSAFSSVTGNKTSCDISFDTMQLDDLAFDHWKHLSLSEKAHYILDKYQIGNLQSEFVALCLSDGSPHCHCDFSTLHSKLAQFQTPKRIQYFFNTCDSNNDEKVTFMEYILCRGFFDKVGNPSDVSEFDVLENVVLGDYALKRERNLSIHLQSLLDDDNEEIEISME
mmetsp:Transcript_33145/g.47948  ORF Transcript_33145/g.47948 Transcript_33145/m.47948 type:complete len:177 (+) Transcript_33145:31-561(+)